MYFPAQTSLIPAVVALTRFLEEQGFSAIFGHYPYWYLGTTPFRYLSGPILPSVLVFLHRLLPNFSLFEIMLGLIGVVWVTGGIGLYFLIRSLTNSSTRGVPCLAAVFYLLGPVVPFLFPFSDGVYLLAFSFLPFILLFYLKFLKRPSPRIGAILVVLVTLAFLIDTLIIPSLLLGMVSLILATGWGRVEVKIKRTVLVLAAGFLVATLWYTPGYWLTLLGSPSFGGKGLAWVIVWLGKMLPLVLAMTLAFFSVKFFKKRELWRDFTLFWLFIFGFLTILRFLSDPDFWQDWTGYGLELQMGVAMGLGLVVKSLKLKVFSLGIFLGGLVYLLFFSFLFNKYVWGALQRDLTGTVEYRIGEWLVQNIRPGEKVFLSGTTAFWLNAFWRIPQVRGGRDQASRDQRWRQATWEIREGTDPEESLKWLKELDVRYLVVHTQDSEEFYHDFVSPEKFETAKGLRRVFSEKGDHIYQVE